MGENISPLSMRNFLEKTFLQLFLASVGSMQIKYSLAETADNMQNLTQIQIALNLAISAEQNNGKAGAGGVKSEGHKEIGKLEKVKILGKVQTINHGLHHHNHRHDHRLIENGTATMFHVEAALG